MFSPHNNFQQEDAPMQIDRLLETLFLLLKSKKTTAHSLARRFEVSVRTIYRDIDTLSLAGIPVYCTRGNGGGIFLDEEYLLERNFLTHTEKEQMTAALQLLKSTNLFPADTLMNKYHLSANSGDEDWLALELNDLEMDNGFVQDFLLLKKGITEKQQVQFIYYSRHGQTSLRTASPVRIIYRQNSWNLLAYCHDNTEYRLYPLKSLRSITLSGRAADLPLPVCTPAEDTIDVRLKFSKRLWYKIYDDFYGKDILRNTDGSYEVGFQLLNNDSLYAYLLSFGNNVEILSPLWLKKEIVEKLKIFLENNQI